MNSERRMKKLINPTPPPSKPFIFDPEELRRTLPNRGIIRMKIKPLNKVTTLPQAPPKSEDLQPKPMRIRFKDNL